MWSLGLLHYQRASEADTAALKELGPIIEQIKNEAAANKK
jgi:hypothetical protein